MQYRPSLLSLSGRDVTAAGHGSAAVTDTDAGLVYVVQGPAYARAEASLARCVCRLLELPVLPFIADLLACEPHQIGDLLMHLHISSA